MNSDFHWLAVVRHLQVFARTCKPTINRNVVFELLPQDRIHVPPPVPDLNITRVTVDNVSAIASFRSASIVDVFRSHLAEHDIGIYAYSGTDAVGHAWAALWHGAKRRIWGYLPVDAGTAGIYFCAVSPSHRGRKIYQHMLVELVRLVFATTPTHRILISCAVHNLPSNAAIERVGFRRLCILTSLHWRGRTISFPGIPKMPDEKSKGQLS
jgi:hypothetical protein